MRCAVFLKLVELECLAALDGLIWLRTGHHAAAKLNASQSFISRQSRKCAEVFELELERVHSEWQLRGDLTLLNLERKVHQLARWRGAAPLRLEAQHWAAQLLNPAAPQGWIPGNCNYLEYHRPLELLRQGTIDAWIASYPDCPDHDDPDLAVIPLSRMPMLLVVQADHPLLALGQRLTLADVARYPILPLPDSAFPKCQRVLEDCGLWRGAADPPPAWQGQSGLDDLLVGYATPLTLSLYGEGIRVLPLRLPLEVGDTLLLPRAHLHYPQARQLLADLQLRLRQLAHHLPEVVLELPGQDLLGVLDTSASPGPGKSAIS